MKRFIKIFVLLLFALSVSAFDNTPGKHTVSLIWTASPTSGVTYNIYRGTSAGVCSGNPIPYVTGITTTFYLDTNVPAGTWYYNVSAYTVTGGESTCDGEVQTTVPSVTTQPDTSLQGTVN